MAIPDSDIDAICSELYQRHSAAWQLIRKRLPTERDDLHASLGAAGVVAFGAKFGGEWRFSVKREGFARIYRPSWLALGVRKDDPILGLESGTDWRYARAHFRLTSALPESDDDSERYRYQVKFKVDTSAADARRQAVLQALKNVAQLEKKSDSKHFTVSIKSKGNQPSATSKPDSVIDWVARLPKVALIVQAMDSVFP